jgi:chitodextrinase
MRIVTLTAALAAVLALSATAAADGPALPVAPGKTFGVDFSATPNPALTGQRIRFDGSGSHTSCYAFFSRCEADTYSWDFGDGTTSSSPVVDHAYSRPGTYTVTLSACYCHYTSTWRSQTHTVTVVGP